MRQSCAVAFDRTTERKNMIWKELNTGLYPWDLHDEGADRILETLQDSVGCNAVYMTALMHYEKRPLHDNYYPHNPVRKRYLAEDAVAYWQPHPEMYKNSRIKPATSRRDFLKGTDWIQVLVDAAKKAGMKVGIAMSHTPLSTERGLEEFQDSIQRDVYGNLLPRFVPGRSNTFHAQQLCWNSPDARIYIQALFRDIATHYELDMCQVSNFLFFAGHPELHPLLGVTLGGCFCEHCEREAKAKGLDWGAIKRTVRRYADVMMRNSLEANEDWLLMQRGNSSDTMLLLENPEIYQWLQFRCESITNYFKELSEAIHDARPGIDFRFNTNWRQGEYIGLDVTRVAPYVDSIRSTNYEEQTGDEQFVLAKGKWLSNLRRQAGEEMTLIPSITPRGKATADLIKKGIKLLALNGADGMSFAFYDAVTTQHLRAIKEGMEEAEITLVS
jgi:hypothetical protein